MATYEEVKRAFFKKETLSDSDSLDDLENLYLVSELSEEGPTQDLWMKWFRQEGYTYNSIQDNWKAYLNDEGYTGAVRDMKKSYFEDNI